MKKIVTRIIQNPLLQHGIFWILSYFILLNIFSLSSTFQRIDYIYTSIFLISLIIPVALNLYVFIPQFLRKNKYLVYGISFLMLLFAFSWINQLIFDRFIDLVLPDYFFISYYSYGDVLKFFGVFMLITTLLQLSKEWFELNRTRQQLILLEKEKIAAELKALANQVNPHFLFNSLNVLYSLAVNQRKESPEAILKLSDILRYVIYESSGETTTLADEVNVIQNYIDLQRFRVGEDSKITFRSDVLHPALSIAPMLLLPLVENGFKHGVKGDVGITFLHILLKVEENILNFTVENNKGSADMESDNGNSGVGLENIRNRLQLLYPERHQLNIEDTEGSFRVILTIRNLS
jgi:sensor histidine kinase YesM